MGYYTGKKVLITGGAGFIGSNLTHRLVREGAQVTVLDSFHPMYGGNEFNFLGIERDIKLIRGDVRDQKLTKDLTAHAEVVYHIASQCSHVDSMVEPFMDVDYNCNGTLSVLEGVRQASTKPRFIYASTRAAIGAPLALPATETTLPNPVDVYGVNKLAGELYSAVYARVHGVRAVSLRLTNCYGPRHQMKSGKYGILNWFISLALQGKPVKIFGTGEQLRDYLFVDDAVDAFVKAGQFSVEDANAKVKTAGHEVPYVVFNVNSGKGTKFVDCAKRVTEIAGSPLEFVAWPADRKAIETGDYIADCSAAKEMLEWSPSMDMADGLARTFEYYREHLKRYL